MNFYKCLIKDVRKALEIVAVTRSSKGNMFSNIISWFFPKTSKTPCFFIYLCNSKESYERTLLGKDWVSLTRWGTWQEKDMLISLAWQGGAEFGFQETLIKVELENVKIKGVCAVLSWCKPRVRRRSSRCQAQRGAKRMITSLNILLWWKKGNKKGWNPCEGFSLILFQAKNFYWKAIIINHFFDDFPISSAIKAIKQKIMNVSIIILIIISTLEEPE